MKNSRRNFVRTVGFTALGAFPIYSIGKSVNPDEDYSLDAELVEEFVRIAHKDDGTVQKMMQEEPHLLNATQDWGDGDFETAIGAAGHMGHKDLANYLIGQGARFDIFVLTMLGKTALVKSWLDLYPHLLNSIGPHGFTLLHHAEKGGDDAAELYDYISELGLTQTFIETFDKG